MVKFALIVIKSSDIQKLKSFYEMIGLQFKREQHGRGPVHYAAQLEGTVFEIYPLSPETTADKTRLGFRLEELDKTVAKLIANNYRVLSPPKQTDYGYTAIAKDPEGRTIELYQQEPKTTN